MRILFALVSLLVILSTSDGRSIRSKRQKVSLPLYPPGSNKPVQPVVLGNMGYAPYNLYPNQPPPIDPFTHNFGFAQGVDWGSQWHFDGELDFPIIDKDRDLYFPGFVGGDFAVGTTPLDLEYGHSINPVNPFDVNVALLYPCLITPRQCHNLVLPADNDHPDPRVNVDLNDLNNPNNRVHLVKEPPKPTILTST